MAKTIKLISFTELLSGFVATGTCDGKQFLAKTILYGKKGEKKEPIFKVVEEGNTAVSLKTSKFTRGERIAIARYLKLVRLCDIEKPQEDLGTLSLRQLRAKCKQQGLRGYWSKGIKKEDLVNMLSACKKPC